MCVAQNLLPPPTSPTAGPSPTSQSSTPASSSPASPSSACGSLSFDTKPQSVETATLPSHRAQSQPCLSPASQRSILSPSSTMSTVTEAKANPVPSPRELPPLPPHCSEPRLFSRRSSDIPLSPRISVEAAQPTLAQSQLRKSTSASLLCTTEDSATLISGTSEQAARSAPSSPSSPGDKPQVRMQYSWFCHSPRSSVLREGSLTHCLHASSKRIKARSIFTKAVTKVETCCCVQDARSFRRLVRTR